MEWVFNTFITWLLNIMVDVFTAITAGFFEFFSVNTISVFYTFFPTLKTVSKSFVAVGYALVLIIAVMVLLKNLLVTITDEYQDPIKLAFRVMVAIFLVSCSVAIVHYEINLGAICYESVEKAFTDKSGKLRSTNDSSFKWTEVQKAFEDNAQSQGTASGAGTVVTDLICLGCIVAIFFNFMKMMLEAAERYVVVALSLLFAPLVAACYASAELAKVFFTFLRMIFNQVLLMAFNLIFVLGTIESLKLFSNRQKGLVASDANSNTGIFYGYIGQVSIDGDPNKTVGNIFTFMMLILAFLIAGQKMDQYMRQIGLDVVQTGGMMNEIGSGLQSINRTMQGVSRGIRARRFAKAARERAKANSGGGESKSYRAAQAINNRTGGTSKTLGKMAGSTAIDGLVGITKGKEGIDTRHRNLGMKEMMRPIDFANKESNMPTKQAQNLFKNLVGQDASAIGMSPLSEISKDGKKGGFQIEDDKSKANIVFGQPKAGYQQLFDNKGNKVEGAFIKSNNAMAGMPSAPNRAALPLSKAVNAESGVLNSVAADKVAAIATKALNTNAMGNAIGSLSVADLSKKQNVTGLGKGEAIGNLGVADPSKKQNITDAYNNTPGKVNSKNITAVSDGRGGFTLSESKLNSDGSQESRNIGKLLSPAETSLLQRSGINVPTIETGMGGNVGFIPSALNNNEVSGYMNGTISTDASSSYVPITNGDNAGKLLDAGCIQSAMQMATIKDSNGKEESLLEHANVPQDALQLGVVYDDISKHFAVNYSDGKGGTITVDGDWDCLQNNIAKNKDSILSALDEDGDVRPILGDTENTCLFDFAQLENEHNSKIAKWDIDEDGDLNINYESGERELYGDAAIRGIHGKEIVGSSGVVWTKLKKPNK